RAAGLEDRFLQRAAVIRLVAVQKTDARILPGELFDDRPRPVAGAVLAEDQLVVPAERVEPAAEIERRLADDRGLVVDRDRDRDHASFRAASRPERSASSIELYSQRPQRPATWMPRPPR